MKHYLLAGKIQFPEDFIDKKVSILANTSYLSGEIKINQESPFYPNRGDEKIMRQDVKASLILLKELIEEIEIESKIETIPLFVANGAFIENTDKHVNKLSNTYKNFLSEMTSEEKARKMYLSTPPLLGLETLTNSTMSFMSQYAGIRGHNTTFGNTSIAAFFALKEALRSLKNNTCAFVCSSNTGGDFSFLTNSSIVGYDEGWKESGAVSCLFLSNTKDNNMVPLCEITKMVNSAKIPVLEKNNIERNWENLLPDPNADLIIFSGAFSKSQYAEDKAYLEKINPSIFSFFEEFGNLGVTNLPAGIVKGIEKIHEGFSIIDILDRDIYGREYLVRIENAK